MMQNSIYHKILRVSAVVCSAVLLFESGLIIDSTAVISQNTHQYLANAVGMNASVEPNEFNVITAELTAQKKALDEREAALAQREIEVNLNQGGEAAQRSTYVIAGLLFIILVLIVLNYILDYLRMRELTLVENETQTV